MSALSEMTLSEVADNIRRRRVSATEVAKDSLARIAKSDSAVNAFVAVDEERALAGADAADRLQASGAELGLLHGVPLAHKDMFYRAGETSTCGSLIRRNWKAPVTADVISRMDSAGAVTLGRLTMSEFAVGPIGLNYHYGPTRNPWNKDHVSGGSSSGPAAAVASRFCFGALGSDTGASIRVPAAACGLVGLKPTLGLISTAGTMPLSSSLDVVGPLTRCVKDAALLTAVVAVPADEDLTASANRSLLDLGEVHARRGMKIGVPSNFFLDELHPEIERSYDEAKRVFDGLGFETVPVDTTVFAEAAGLYGDILGFEASAFHSKYLATRPHDYSPQVRARLERGQSVSVGSYSLALSQRQRLVVRAIAQVFVSCDVVLAPVLATPVPTIEAADVGDGPRMSQVIDAFLRLTKPVNVLGLPALALPAGFTSNGLPTGVQLIGAPWSEPRLLAVGSAYEREAAWHRRSPITDAF